MQQWEWNPTLYAQVDFWKKIYGPPLCVFFLFFIFFYFFETQWKVSQYLVESLPHNSGTTQNGFWYKETDKRAQNGDKKRSKTL